MGDTVQITMGQSPDGSTYSETPSDYILVQGNADLKDGWVSPRVWTSQMTKKADAGDLIMSVRAPAGAMGKTAYNAVIGRGVAAIKGNEFIYQSLVKMDSNGYWKKLSSGSTFESLNSNNIKDAEIFVPCDEEQQKIGQYFSNLDNLITLHQRKLFLNFVKKNDWEQRKLNEVAEFNPKSELPDEFEYVDLESVVGTEMISHRTETKDSAPSRAQRLAQPGDVFFQTVRPYQKNNYLFSKLDNNYVFSTGYAQMRPNIDTAFLMSFLQTDSFVKIVLDNCTGTSYPAINSNDLSNLEISLPKSFEEQKKVGKTIISIDNLITLHQRKCDETKKLKKFMLQKMFPKKDANKPEIRFAGFTDDWEQRKWIDTVDISTEMVDPTTGEYDDMPHIAPGNIEPFTGRILDNVKTVKEEQLISGKFRFRPNDVVYGKINPQLGKYFYASIDGLTSADAYVFNGKNGITQKFLYSVLQTKDFFKYSISVSKRSGMPKINRDELNAYSFCVPKEEEQEKIGDFLLGIDNLITLHRRAYYNKKGGLTNVHNDNQQHYAIL